jgi:hypothetical protein
VVLNVHISPSLTLLRLTYSAAAVANLKVPHGPKPHSHEPFLRVPVSGRPPVANGTHAISVPSEDLFQLIFRVGDSSPTSDVPSLSDGDSGPPSAEVPELAERWHGLSPVTSPVVYYNPSPGLFSPGAPFASPAYAPWVSPKQVNRLEPRRHGMSTRKLKAIKSKMTRRLQHAVVLDSRPAYLLAKHCKFFKKDGSCPQGSLCTL